MLLLESLRRQCDHPARGLTRPPQAGQRLVAEVLCGSKGEDLHRRKSEVIRAIHQEGSPCLHRGQPEVIRAMMINVYLTHVGH